MKMAMESAFSLTYREGYRTSLIDAVKEELLIAVSGEVVLPCLRICLNPSAAHETVYFSELCVRQLSINILPSRFVRRHDAARFLLTIRGMCDIMMAVSVFERPKE